MHKVMKQLLAAGALGAAALYQGIVTRRYVVRTKKLRKDQRFRIALVADLHSHIFGGNQQPLLRKIWNGKPDAVLLAGDIYDNRIAPDGVRLLLQGLRGMSAWYTPGNHEYRVGNYEKIKLLFQQYGVTVLRDCWTAAQIADIPVILAGADDPERKIWLDTYYDHVKEKARAFSGMPTDRYCILLAHKPEHIVQYVKYPFDLVVSGHAHGGQVRLPGLCNGMYSPGQGIFPQYCGGRYQHGKLTHIVSRGLAVYWYLPRVWNPPELVFIDVIGSV